MSNMKLTAMSKKKWLERFNLLDFRDKVDSAERYPIFRRNIMLLMMLVTILPLCLMAAINYHQYQRALRDEIVNPMRTLVNKTKHSIELLLAERVSSLSFIASAYTFEQLSDESTLNRIFAVMEREFRGFVDLGLINSAGDQVSYVGPYDLRGKNYSEQPWFHEVLVQGSYISDVFMGHRRFPHIVIAVQRRLPDGMVWVLRATINTERFDDLIASMGLEPSSDAFLLNKSGILQTTSRSYGKVLDSFPLELPPVSLEANVIEAADPRGKPVLLTYTYFPRAPYILAVIKPRSEVLKTWYTLKSELLFLFLGSVGVILLVILKLTDVLVRRMRESDEKREAAFREMEHTHKLSSIGRLAAGVAHEINNPMAIINEKAGLMKDLLGYAAAFPDKEKFISLIDAVLQSVHRCRSVTHRLLGFAKRMEVQIEQLDLNETVRETLGFLEKEAMYRNIDLRVNMAERLPAIASDRGQLQQVFLNLLNNAFAAVAEGGLVVVTTWQKSPNSVAVCIQDNGCGMSKDVLKHIFEPFFTTKKESGTGLGLPITYGIVTKLGGSIEVQSQEGEGTIFTVLLPVNQRVGE
ncbi:MAG: ATP-binding protein [Syntrophobacteraceae bacterium]